MPAHSASVSPAQKARQELSVDRVDTRYLQTLLGYNARRASVALIDSFLQSVTGFDLRTVDFSVLSVIRHQPGVTSRQLCHLLNVLPPNLVGLIQSLEARGLIHRLPHPSDGRAMGLHPTPEGEALIAQAELAATDMEIERSSRLTATQRKTLLDLLQKIYL